jgi:hypothetical protein
MKHLLRSFALIATLLPTLALAQSAPANLPFHSVFGRLGNSPGDTGPGQAIPFATLATQLGVTGIPSVSIESYRGGCGVADNTAALQAAVNSIPGAIRITFPNSCTYRFTQANALEFSKPVFLQGAATATTILSYNPTTDGIFLRWANRNGAAVLYAGGGAGMDNLTLTSPDTTHTKIMVQMVDGSGFRVTNTTFGWPYGGVTGGTGSTCLYILGRETSVFQNITSQCDQPLRLGWGADQFHFSDLYLQAFPGFPLITVDPGTTFGDVVFDGYQAWVLGTDGFHFVDTAAVNAVIGVPSPGSGYTVGQTVTLTGGTCSLPIKVMVTNVTNTGGILLPVKVLEPGVCSVTPSNPIAASSGGATFTTQLSTSFRLTFRNVRTEQGYGPGASTYSFNIQTAGGLQGLTIDNVQMDSARCGVFLKNVVYPTFKGNTYPTDGGLTCAINATAANNVDALTYLGNWWQPGALQDVTGLVAAYKRYGSSLNSSTTVPADAFYTKPPGVGTLFDSVQSTLYNNMGITPPASSANLVPGAGKTFAFNNTMALSSTDGAAINFGAGGTVSYTSGGAAFTKTDDPNVTLTLTGTPATALLQAVGVTVGWNGTLAASRGGTGLSSLGAGVPAALGINNGSAGAFVTLSGLGGTPSSITLTNGTGLPISTGLTGAGTGVLAALAANVGSAGAPVTFNGAGGTPSSITLTNASGLPFATGGTGQVALANGGTAASLTASNGGIFYSTATAGAVLAGTATARLPLLSGASTVPVWGAFTLPSSVTSGGIPYFSSTSAESSSALLAANALMIGGGAGAAPSTTTTGTGILTALGVNVGSAGAPVVNGGALGTPSSGNGSNLTGVVNSIAGNNGAFTLTGGITNSTNAIKRSLTEATLQASPADPTSTTSTTGVMMGLGSTCTITPAYSTRAQVNFYGDYFNSTNNNGLTLKIRYGTGTAPANGGASTGTQLANTLFGNVPSIGVGIPFSQGGIITGLTPGTTYWIDYSAGVAGGGTVGILSMSCTAMEF